jgi:hypothetical protein
VSIKIVKSHGGEHETIWPGKKLVLGCSARAEHDLSVALAPGDMVYFVVSRRRGRRRAEVMWNPEVSYRAQ